MSPQDDVTRKQVEAFLDEMQSRYGLTDENVRQLVRDWEWVRDLRRRTDAAGGWFARAVITVVVTGFALAVWHGFKALTQGRLP